MAPMFALLHSVDACLRCLNSVLDAFKVSAEFFFEKVHLGFRDCEPRRHLLTALGELYCCHLSCLIGKCFLLIDESVRIGVYQFLPQDCFGFLQRVRALFNNPVLECLALLQLTATTLLSVL
jgi:hypothetical protein